MLVAATAPGAERAHLVELERGDRIIASSVSARENAIVLTHPILGELVLHPSDIASMRLVNAPTEPSHDVHQPAAVDAAGRSDQAGRPQEEPLPPAAASLAEGWGGRLGAALTASKTSSETYNLRLSGQLKRDVTDSKTDISATYYLNAADGAVTDNDLRVRGDQNWMAHGSVWKPFLQATYQYDQFEAWAHRVSPYGGLGVELIGTDDVTLTLKGGGGVTWGVRGRNRPPAGAGGSGVFHSARQSAVDCRLFVNCTRRGESLRVPCDDQVGLADQAR